MRPTRRKSSASSITSTPSGFRLLELAAGLLAGHDGVGLLADAAGHPSSGAFDQRGGLGARQRRQRAGEDVGLAGQRAVGRAGGGLGEVEPRRARGARSGPGSRGSRKNATHRLGDGGPDAGHLVDRLLGRRCQRRPWCRTAGRGAPPPSCRRAGSRARRGGSTAAAPSRPRWPRRAASADCSANRSSSTSCSTVSVVQVGHVRDEPGVEQLADALVAEAADVHRAARGEVDDALEHPAGTARVGTVPHRLARPAARPACRSRGSASGMRNGAAWLAGVDALEHRRATTCGITSPARMTSTQSPTRMSFCAIRSSLCSVALLTVTPADLDRLERWRRD